MRMMSLKERSSGMMRQNRWECNNFNANYVNDKTLVNSEFNADYKGFSLEHLLAHDLILTVIFSFV